MRKVKNIVWVIFGLAGICLFFYKISIRVFTDYLLKDNAQTTKAVIINEKNYMPNQPVKAEFSYSYQFEVNGKKYTGNSHNSSLKIGDTIEIEYVKYIPSLTKPLHQKE